MTLCALYLEAMDKLELAPALRGSVWTLTREMNGRMKRCGRWATARYMAKRGFPIELAFAAIYY